MLSEREAASRSCAAAAAAAAANASGAAGAAARGASASAAAAPPGSRRAARRFGGARSGGTGGGRTDNGSGGGITNDVGDCGVLLVRRRTAAGRPPAGFGLGEANATAVDWRATVLLNLSLQSSYALAVVACRKGALRDSSSSVPRAIAAASSSAAAAAAAAAAAKKDEKGGGTRAAAAAASSSKTGPSGPLPPLALPLGGHGVRHDVFASPMRLAFEVTGGGGGGGMSGTSGPEPSYPEICFSVDGEAGLGAAAPASSSSSSSSSFRAPPLSSLSSELELASPGDVFAVFLVATGGPALATGPAEAAAKEGGGGGEKEQQPKEQEREKKESFVEIFSGFVSYEQLVAALPCAKIAAASSSGSSGGGGGDGRREHVRMRGPGGQGVADVAVGVLFRRDASAAAPSSSGRDLVARTVAARDGHDAAAPSSSSSSSALAATARALFRAAAAAVAPPSQRTPPAGPPVFGCSLFCLSLPVETLAGRLLGLPDSSSASSSQ